MISQQGQVVETHGDLAMVQVGGVSGCPACEAGRGCGAGIFGRLLRKSPLVVTVRNEIAATSGQSVELGISETVFLYLVFRLYSIPLLAGLTGATGGLWLAAARDASILIQDLATLIFGVSAAGLATIWTRRKLREFPGHLTVHLMQVLESSADDDCKRIVIR